MNDLKDEFSLDPQIIFLNHGSFGACPKTVFDRYQAYQRELEHQPVKFMVDQAVELLAEARSALGAYLGVSGDNLVYFPNPTTAINMVARSLDTLLEGCAGRAIRAGDHILTTDHEYGALDRTWNFTCNRLGMNYIQRMIPIPVTTHEDFVEHFWNGVNENTRMIYISHISSPTALIFPIAELCQRARDAGILSVVDGAHAVGQVPLDLEELGADIYTGACHKWLCAPKGSAFIYVRPDLQEHLDPLVVSWGYQADEGFGSGNKFIDYHEWQGTRDLAAFLAVPAAIEFQHQNQWEEVQERCSRLATATRGRINALTGLPPICPEDAGWYQQMFSAYLPDDVEPGALKDKLISDHQIEIPTIDWNGIKLLRVSIQGYNDLADTDALIDALKQYI